MSPTLWLLAMMIVGASAVDTCLDLAGLSTCAGWVAIDADFACADLFCDECEFPHNCDTLCGLCDESELTTDCDGNVVPSFWNGDGFCDARFYMYDSEVINLNCPEFDCDTGDCASPDVNGLSAPCQTAAPTPATPVPTGFLAIADIQRQDSPDTAPFLYEYDCYPSPLEKEMVRVRGVVSLIAEFGFYMQDQAAAWSGIFVYTGSTSIALSSLEVGYEVDVSGMVDERLGQTQLEVVDEGIVVLSFDNELVPVSISSAELGVYRKHAADGASCPAAERYEGVLVRFERATLRGLADSFGRMEVFDQSGVATLLDSYQSSFDTAAYVATLESADCADRALAGCSNLANVELDSVVGVVRYVWSCNFNKFSYYQCITQNKGFLFSFAIQPRDAGDLVTAASSWDDAVRAPSRAPTADVSSPSGVAVQFLDEIRKLQYLRTPSNAAEWECAPSAYLGTAIEVSGTVTALDSFGFYMQDKSAAWSGVYVAEVDPSDSAGAAASDVSVGSVVRVRGVVAESLGSTMIEAWSVTVTGSGLATPLKVRSGVLGLYRVVSEVGCLETAEAYESLLVQIEEGEFVQFSGDSAAKCAACLDGIRLDDGSGQALADTALYAGGDLMSELLSHVGSDGGSVASVTGIVRYAYQCEHKTNPVYCTTRLASFHFAYLVSPRSAADLAWHGDSADSSAGSKTKRKKDGASPRARQLLGLVLAIMALAALAGLALGYACTRRRKRNYAFAQRSALYLGQESSEIPVAHATELVFCDHSATLAQVRSDDGGSSNDDLEHRGSNNDPVATLSNYADVRPSHALLVSPSRGAASASAHTTTGLAPVSSSRSSSTTPSSRGGGDGGDGGGGGGAPSGKGS